MENWDNITEELFRSYCLNYKDLRDDFCTYGERKDEE